MINGNKLGDLSQLVKTHPISTLGQANALCLHLNNNKVAMWLYWKEEEIRMHHLPVKSNLVDSGLDSSELGMEDNGHHQPLCPKPRRLGPPIPEFLKPLRCSKHSQEDKNGRNGILNIIAEKRNDHGREATCSGCSPCCYSGSPPGRTDNPLVHDVHFIHQMEHSPFKRTNLSDKLGFTSSASPV